MTVVGWPWPDATDATCPHLLLCLTIMEGESLEKPVSRDKDFSPPVASLLSELFPTLFSSFLTATRRFALSWIGFQSGAASSADGSAVPGGAAVEAAMSAPTQVPANRSWARRPVRTDRSCVMKFKNGYGTTLPGSGEWKQSLR